MVAPLLLVTDTLPEPAEVASIPFLELFEPTNTRFAELATVTDAADFTFNAALFEPRT